MLSCSNPPNHAIVSDHHVATSTGVMLRPIIYVNPADGVTYTCLTNDSTLPAHVLVLIHKHRWNIEIRLRQLGSLPA